MMIRIMLIKDKVMKIKQSNLANKVRNLEVKGLFLKMFSAFMKTKMIIRL
ncbi:MAG: hypothetical protein MR210_05930 [Erysipelotrichaceae bacterium]|nr:hypothetical protein [Erysipelotrichaceae bacterium]MDY5251273.1 hypothetical protein [Erysipelotrichaceae bacterium]